MKNVQLLFLSFEKLNISNRAAGVYGEESLYGSVQ